MSAFSFYVAIDEIQYTTTPQEFEMPLSREGDDRC